jgi:hypothetical protein
MSITVTRRRIMISFLCVGSIKLSPRKNSTSMTGDRITLLARSRDSNQDKVMVWTCPILCRGKVVKPLVASSSPNSVPALNIGVRLSHLQWCPPGPPASLHTHDHPFPVQHYLGGDASSPSAGTRTSPCGSRTSPCLLCSTTPLHPDAGQSAVQGGGSDLEGGRPEHSHEPAAAPNPHIGRVQAGGV